MTSALDFSLFADNAREGVLLLPECSACGRAHWYPRPFCPHCASQDLLWRKARGRGTIYSFSIFRRVAEPYCIAYVALDEGPIMLTNIVNSAFDEVAIGKPVKVEFRSDGDGNSMPYFALCPENGTAS